MIRHLTLRYSLGLLLCCTLTAAISDSAWAGAREQARRIHDRIAGVPPDEATLDQMESLVGAGDAYDAAMLATTAPEFYNVTLKNFATPWTNEAGDVFAPLNDYTATIIGMVRDDADFRDVLSADLVYVGSGSGVPAYSASSNAHYEALESQGADLSSVLSPTPQSSVAPLPASATAGVMTTRAAAKAFLIDGTNRAMFRFTLINHMCRDLEQVQDTTRPPDRIRQDVSRSPGGDSRVFLNNCIGCHSGMDPLIQAFAYYDYAYDEASDPDGESGSISYNDAGETDPETGTRVVAKYFNNDTTFEHGYATPDDSWVNYWRAGQNALLGWDESLPGSGNGAKSFGRELAQTDAFASCQVTKVFENVCLRPPQDSADRSQIDAMVASFRGSGYNLKTVFAESAVYCMGN